MGALLDNVRSRLFGTPDLPLTDVGDEVRGAGTAFAALIEGVGKAVADTQRELDETAGHIAKEMANTKVDTVQAVVSNYADLTGRLTDVKVISGKTSALSIAVPPALSFKRVHLEGSFVATEFSGTSTSNVNVNLVGVAVGSHGFGMRGPSIGASVANANTDTQSQQTQDSSVASMSMVAEIRPKPVMALPKPPMIFHGPKLTMTVVATGTANLYPVPTASTDPPFLDKRYAVIMVKLLAFDGSIPQASQTIALDCGTLDWVVADPQAPLVAIDSAPTTDSGTGVFHITIGRTVTDNAAPKKDFVIRGSLNLVNGTCNVSL